jgi:hypothetical protein
MPQQLAGDAFCLGSAMLFGGFICALAQFAPLASGWIRREPVRARPCCMRTSEISRSRRILLSISFALLLTITPGVLAALLTQSAIAVAAAELGALAGLWLSARIDLTRRARLVAAMGCVVGVAATGLSVICMVSMPQHTVGMRIALYVTAIWGALALGASTFILAREPRTFARKHAPLSRGEYALHLTAVALIAALGEGFATVHIGTSRSSMEFALSALGAACVLAAALGVRLMGGARRMPRSRPARTAQNVLKRPAAVSFATVPDTDSIDSWLVTACGTAANEPAAFDTWLSLYEPPGETLRDTHHASRDSPRRRRNRRRETSTLR